ncbi:MAG: hypothetical protein ACN6I5_00985 [Hyphomicrobiales bacterium]
MDGLVAGGAVAWSTDAEVIIGGDRHHDLMLSNNLAQPRLSWPSPVRRDLIEHDPRGRRASAVCRARDRRSALVLRGRRRGF